MSAASKLISMQQAVAEHVPSGSMVLLGAQLEQMIPFAAGHELIRQGRRDLTLVGPISDILFDQLIGAGCVSHVLAARSEEHTSELQSLAYLVCRLLLEKKKNNQTRRIATT